MRVPVDYAPSSPPFLCANPPPTGNPLPYPRDLQRPSDSSKGEIEKSAMGCGVVRGCARKSVVADFKEKHRERLIFYVNSAPFRSFWCIKQALYAGWTPLINQDGDV
ncbi:hypothetical protein EVAR_75672_1 [Eumeta japonica]|uniref:Uncharacterized protein n=1 Tax=Eumeta variegata TaxID=151549 RepID=A0A4C1U0E5_EUMVA|nr:hypothetical protein EVAR_75672_1 [Eumeta japonica]